MKTTSILIALAISLSVYAQADDFWNQIVKLGKQEVIDQANIECVYYHLVSDPVLNTSSEEYGMLQVGKQLTKYMEYAKFQMDSTLNCMDVSKMTNWDFEVICRKLPRYANRRHCILKELSTGRIEVHDNVFIDYYVYEEPQPDFGWMLTNDTLTVCGHLCQKATATFRGREWTAWYAEDVPVSDGPWKFSGLPGLILQIEDSEREHVFRAISVRKGNSNIIQEDYQDFKTNREWFNKALREYKMNPSGSMQGTDLMPKNLDGTDAIPPNRRQFFNPIEKE